MAEVKTSGGHSTADVLGAFYRELGSNGIVGELRDGLVEEYAVAMRYGDDHLIVHGSSIDA